MISPLEKKIKEKTACIAVIGLGYVGLTILQAFSRAGYKTVGYDRNKHKIEALEQGMNYVQGIDIASLFPLIENKRCAVSNDRSSLEGCDVFIITVPTSLDPHKAPDLSKVKNAAHVIASHLKKGCLVIMQSTSFPSTTETIVLPILKESHLKEGEDFHLSFVPEVSDFGNNKLDFAKVPKIVGGLTERCANLSSMLYSAVVDKVNIVSSMQVAESAKILQNAYRLVNISFINEMKLMFDSMGIDIWEVIAAAATKPFGFTPFYPGPGIGGDCIPVDPCYMIWKAKETNGPTTMLSRAIEVNDEITAHVVKKVIHALSLDHKGAKDASILLLGVAFKKDVSDIRESASLKILSALQKEGMAVDYHDPFIARLHPSAFYPQMHMSSIIWQKSDIGSYDCVVILTDHTFYSWDEIGQRAKKIVDTRSVMSPFLQYHHKVVKA